MEDWNSCLICGDLSGDLKCPADSFQNNGSEVYQSFLDSVRGFREINAMPTSVKLIDSDVTSSIL